MKNRFPRSLADSIDHRDAGRGDVGYTRGEFNLDLQRVLSHSLAMDQDPVSLALRAALGVSDSIELRLALGDHLLRSGVAKDALVEFEAALRLQPTHRQALTSAAAAADAAAEPARANAYRLTLAALDGAAAAPSRPTAPVAAIAPLVSAAGEAPTATIGGENPRLRLIAADEPLPEPELPPTTFADVGGMDEVKQRLQRAFLTPLRQPELLKKFGKTISGGFVLYGPPGCGKTFLARAVAGEIGARFVNIGLSDVLDMWFGESERKLHELFESARRHRPTLIFIDEVDALGQRRTSLRGAAGRTLVNQLLTELDGIAARNDGLFVLGATNHPWDLDPALRRPGRFDRLLFVPAPDAEARRQIFALKLAGRPLAPGFDFKAAAQATQGFSGADIEAVTRGAVDLAIELSLQRGVDAVIDGRLLAQAIADVRPSTRAWFETARNYALYANEGGVYDDMLPHLRAMGLA
jgi:AAA+ superfamily predicted ATPase